MKIVKKNPENCHFYSREKSLYAAWACFRNDHFSLIGSRTQNTTTCLIDEMVIRLCRSSTKLSFDKTVLY